MRCCPNCSVQQRLAFGGRSNGTRRQAARLSFGLVQEILWATNGSAGLSREAKMPSNPSDRFSRGYGPWIANRYSAAWFKRLTNLTENKSAAASAAMMRIDQASAVRYGANPVQRAVSDWPLFHPLRH